jgi:hypothetical protein
MAADVKPATAVREIIILLEPSTQARRSTAFLHRDTWRALEQAHRRIARGAGARGHRRLDICGEEGCGSDPVSIS